MSDLKRLTTVLADTHKALVVAEHNQQKMWRVLNALLELLVTKGVFTMQEVHEIGERQAAARSETIQKYIAHMKEHGTPPTAAQLADMVTQADEGNDDATTAEKAAIEGEATGDNGGEDSAGAPSVRIIRATS